MVYTSLFPFLHTNIVYRRGLQWHPNLWVFLSWWRKKEERSLINSWQGKPLIWRRYIDDIFMIWTHGEEKLDDFLTNLNAFHHSIKFTFEISSTEATFLDVTVYKGERFKTTQVLDCRTYLKPTNTFQYVLGSSCHPAGVKKGISIGECLRFLRNTSTDEEFKQQRDNLLAHLQCRGYPPNRPRRDSWILNLPKEKNTYKIKQKKRRNDLFLSQLSTHGGVPWEKPSWNTGPTLNQT